MMKIIVTKSNRRTREIIPGALAGILAAAFLFLTVAYPVNAGQMRDFEPIQRTDLYDRDFMNDFFTALGSYPQGISPIEESATVRTLVDGGSKAERGDVDGALFAFDMIPDNITSAFPFLTTMHEDLLVPEILEPWYDYEPARDMLIRFYEDVWLPHPEYRDDYLSFKEDTMGRASRLDPDVPAVWILGHLADYGFIPDRMLTEDDPYLFIWDLLTGFSYYAQRSTYYGLNWNQYDEGDYKNAVLKRVGTIIHEAHDKAASQEMGRGFWSDLVTSHFPLETPTEGTRSTGEIFTPPPTEPTSQPGPSEPAPSATPQTSEETDHTGLFQVPPELREPPSDSEAREILIESLIDDLEARIETRLESIYQQPAEDMTGPDVTEVEPAETETEDIPDEFLYEPETDLTPSEAEAETAPPVEIGNYARVRLGEIADQLAINIGVLASDLGSETIDLVILYNDQNVSEETIVNSEHRYIAKREAFLAGLAVWDRFDMEIFSPLTLADFNDLVISDLRGQYEELKASSTRWEQYQAYEDHFEEALGQIESGTRNRRDEPDVLAAEAAALTAFLGEYNDLIKEIEDLISGSVTESIEEEPE